MEHISSDKKYNTLVSIIDSLRKEAPIEYKSYHPIEDNIEELTKARSKAYLHLYLKVKYGLEDFQDREKYITDGTGDAGIDAYYIDTENKKIFYIQSKFRNCSSNFEDKEIQLNELIKMDIDGVSCGHDSDKNGNEYNSKIKKFMKEINEIEGLAKYEHEVIVLANVKNKHKQDFGKIIGNYKIHIYDHTKAYDDLVFPIVSGTFYNQEELVIRINTNNDNSRVKYSVQTKDEECEISLLFVPIIEIAKAMEKYKNSILKYNPRSYLEMKKGSVNFKIAETIINKTDNEFSLFNNGLTILSDETYITEKSGKKNIGELLLTNPQIINGGQTAYTLAWLYRDCLDGKRNESVFHGKEVLVKIISFDPEEKGRMSEKKLRLIEEISKATNQQTEVDEADRRSNDKVQLELQKLIFNKYGYFYLRKAGEFGEGFDKKYISTKDIVERDKFLRVVYSCFGKPSEARRSGSKTLFQKEKFDEVLPNTNDYEKYIFAYELDAAIWKIHKNYNEKNNKDGIVNFGYALRYGRYAIIASIMKYYKIIKNEDIKITVNKFLAKWLEFEKSVLENKDNSRYIETRLDPDTNKIYDNLNYDKFYKGATVNNEIKRFNFLE